MKIKDLFQVLAKGQRVCIIGRGYDFEEQVYWIEWHKKEVLDLEIENVGCDEKTIVILLKREEKEE